MQQWPAIAVADVAGFMPVHAIGVDRTGEALFAQARHDGTAELRALSARGAGAARRFGAPGADFSYVDRFQNGDFLVVGARASWRSAEDVDQNAWRVDAQTGAVRRFLLGDGLSGILIDLQDRIWAWYFDEGVCGNRGWFSPGPEPIGAAGLNVFDGDGRLVWRFDQARAGYTISDCYALTLSGADAWLYAYTDFLLTRVTPDFRVECWATPVAGAKLLAVAGERAVLGGAYGSALEEVVLCRFAENRLIEIERLQLVDPTGAPFWPNATVARDGRIHMFTGQAWLAWDLRSLSS